MTGIYKIVSPDGIYIGQSRNIKKRWACLRARKRPSERLFRSFKKFGVDKHEFIVIHELPKDVSNHILDEFEKLYILLYKESGYFLFNRQDGGIGAGHEILPETREKIRKTLLGQKHTPERIAKIKANRKLTAESKRRISESLKEYFKNRK